MAKATDSGKTSGSRAERITNTGKLVGPWLNPKPTPPPAKDKGGK